MNSSDTLNSCQETEEQLRVLSSQNEFDIRQYEKGIKHIDKHGPFKSFQGTGDWLLVPARLCLYPCRFCSFQRQDKHKSMQPTT